MKYIVHYNKIFKELIRAAVDAESEEEAIANVKCGGCYRLERDEETYKWKCTEEEVDSLDITWVEGDIEQLIRPEKCPFKKIGEDNPEIALLRKLEQAILKLPFGENQALPWCRESFPELDSILKELEDIKKDEKK